MTYFCTVHKDENQNDLRGEMLDACTSHMVIHTSYDLSSLRDSLPSWQVIWEMEKCADAKFGWRFARLAGIPT